MRTPGENSAGSRPRRRRAFQFGFLLVLVAASSQVAGFGLVDEDADPVARAGARQVNCPSSSACVGTAGADNISGTANANSIDSRGGGDTAIGRGGNDKIQGDGGADDLRGGGGSDTLIGGAGRDELIGGSGHDTILAADGLVDTIQCGTGSDKVQSDAQDVFLDKSNCEMINGAAYPPPPPPPPPTPTPDPVPPAPPVATTPVLTFTNGVTDNYKACWNANPDVRDGRTWGQFTSVVVPANGVATTWQPVDFAALPVHKLAPTLSMRETSAGPAATAELKMTIPNGAGYVSSSQFRSQQNAAFGPLLNLASMFAGPVTLRLQLVRLSDSAVLGAGDITYAPSATPGPQPKPNCDTATGAQLEWNGPGGQFAANGATWRYDWAPAPAPAVAVKTKTTTNTGTRLTIPTLRW